MTRPYNKTYWNTHRAHAWKRAASLGVWCSVFALVTGYLVVANDLATKGIERARLEHELRITEQTIDELHVNVAKLQSLDVVSQDPAIQEMVDNGNAVHHVSTAQATLAAR